MQVVETAVGHDQDHVSAAKFPFKKLQNGIRIREIIGLPAQAPQILDQFLGGESFPFRDLGQVRRFANDDPVGALKGPGVFRLKDRTPTGVGSGLKDGDQPPPQVLGPEGLEGQADRRRMVGKIVDHRDPGFHPPHLLPAMDPLKPGYSRWP